MAGERSPEEKNKNKKTNWHFETGRGGGTRPPPLPSTGSHHRIYRLVWLSQKASNPAASLSRTRRRRRKDSMFVSRLKEEEGGGGDSSAQRRVLSYLSPSCSSSSSS